MKWKLIAGAVLIGAAFLAGWCARPTPSPVHRDVIVTPAAIRALMPDMDPGWLGKIWRDALEREQRAVAPGGAVAEVRAFCDPVAAADTARAAVAGPVERASEPIPVPPPDLRTFIYAYEVDKPFPSFFRRSRIDHYGVRNDGALTHETYRGAGDVAGRAAGDSMPAQGSRWWWVQDLVELGACIEIGRVSAGSFP